MSYDVSYNTLLGETDDGHCRNMREKSDHFHSRNSHCSIGVIYVLADEYGRCTSLEKQRCDKYEPFHSVPSTLKTILTFITARQLPTFQQSSANDVYKCKFRRKQLPMSFLVFTCLLSCLLVCEARSSVKGGPPRLLGEAKTKVSAEVGEKLVLMCMVAADPLPLTSWRVNGELVSTAGWPRLKKHGPNLQIRSVKLSDAGTYRCTATNGFGSENFEIKLAVTEATSEKPTLSKPRFVLPAKMRRRMLVKPAGRPLRFRCKASGYPTPKIEWYKDGNLSITANSKIRPVWVYTINTLTANDSGQYRCRVWNNLGEISYTYKLRVIDELRERPILLEPHPMNTTVRVGGMTTIQCRVHSMVEPTVKWIKRLDKKAVAAYGDNPPGNMLQIENNHYLILPTQEMLSLPDGSYLNKLVIRKATEEHAGMYICLGANTIGYNYRFAYLTVLRDPVMAPVRSTVPPVAGKNQAHRTIIRKQNNLPLPVIIGIPAGLGLLTAIVITWYCQKRRDEKLKNEAGNLTMSGSGQLSAAGSVETKSSTRSSPIPQEVEGQTGENNNKAEPDQTTCKQYTDRNSNHDSVYTRRHRYVYGSPPTAGTPLLTLTEPNDTDYQLENTDENNCGPCAPPPSVAALSQAPSCYSSSDKNYFFVPPPPPPPSQYSASSVSSSPDTMPQYRPHYHYLHPPHSSSSGSSSRRHYHHPHHHHGHTHHSRSDYHVC